MKNERGKTINNKNITSDKIYTIKCSKKYLNNSYEVAIKRINKAQSIFFKDEKNFIITTEDNFIIHFYLLLLQKTPKSENIQILMKMKKLKNKIKNCSNSIVMLLPKFLLISLIDSKNLSKHLKKENLKLEIYKLIKIYFINAIIDKEILLHLLKLIIVINNKDINEIVYFLLSFNQCNLNGENILNLEYIICNFIDFIDKIIGNNYQIFFMLSNNKYLYKLLELNKISKNFMKTIISFLVKIYKFNFDINLPLFEMNNLFILAQNEDILTKIENLKSRNDFFTELLRREREFILLNEKIIISDCFYFDGNKESGINITNNIVTNTTFSIAISFLIIECKNKLKYTIFSFSKNKNYISLYVENNTLKFYSNGYNYDLFSNIKINKNYICYILHDEINGNNHFYLNGVKSGIINKIKFPKKNCELNIGFTKYKKETKDNFIGIIGSFILFNIVLDENSLKNLIELNNDFDKIIYSNSNLEFSSFREETQTILEKFKNNDIINHIDIYMTSNKTNKNLNYTIQNLKRISFQDSFESFINNNGVKYLEMQLHWFIGIIDNVKDLKEINLNLNIREICDIFFSCLRRMTSKQLIKNQNDIKYFFYTLNNLMEISISYGFKIDFLFLSLFLGNIDTILLAEKWFSFCLFLLSLDYNNASKNKSFEILFNGLSSYIIECKKQILTKEFFEKLLKLDIIFSSNEYDKSTKKAYSELVRKSLTVILNDGKFDFFSLYIMKFKEFKPNLEIKDLSEKEISKTPNWDIKSPNNCSIICEMENETLNKDNNEKPNLLLIYKYLKNIYYVLDKNKNKTFANFMIFCNNGLFADFLKEILYYLIKTYNIKCENYEQSKNTTPSNEMDDLKLSELLKSLCISFLLEIDETITNEGKFNKSLTFINAQNNSDNLLQRNYSMLAVETNNKSNISINISNNFYLNIFNSIDISPFTFRSIFLHNFPNMPNFKKIKYIKNISDTSQLIFSEGKFLPESQEFTKNLIELIEKVGSEGFNTFFMSKYLFLEYMYEIFNNTINNLFKYLTYNRQSTPNINNNIILPLKNELNYTDELILKFYIVILNCIERNLSEIKKIDNIGNCTNEKNIEIIKHLGEFKNVITQKIFYLIDLTVFTFKDPFYFKLLFEIYTADENDIQCFHDNDFVLNIIKYIIGKMNIYDTSKNMNLAFELNNKNLLILMYKMIFFINKREFLLSSEIFTTDIILYLSTFWTKSNIFFYKILFPLENINDINNNSKVNKKLLVELLFEIFVNLYLEYNKKEDSSSQLLEGLITDLLSLSEIKDVISRLNKVLSILNDDLIELKVMINKKSKNTHSFFYLMDKICIKQNMISDLILNNPDFNRVNNYNLIRDYIISENKSQNNFSVTILFLIKIIVYIQIFENNSGEKGLLKFFKEIAMKLCKDAKELYEKNKEYNPLMINNKENSNLYKEFQDYIIKQYKPKSGLDFLFAKIQNCQEEIRQYKSIEYFIKYKECSEKKESRSSSMKFFRLKSLFRRKGSKNDFFRKSYHNKKKEEDSGDYVVAPKFKKDYIRRIFSIYLLDLLSYDKDFINLKNIYYNLYSKEFGNKEIIYNLSYPTKLKNRITANYLKIFLKKDFNFFTSDYLKFTHKYLKNNEKFKNSISKILFPSKKLLSVYDYLFNISNPTDHIKKNCELITLNGTIYGNLFFYNNCILFKSNKNDERLSKNDDLTYLCCSSEFDFLSINKKIIIEFNEILQVLSRRYIYLQIALEIFMKNGRSYLFNFFNEEENNYILDYLSKKGVNVIKNPKQYFTTNEYAQKWKNYQIKTFDYLLLLNKFSSRSYNELDQYPVMPWIFLLDKKDRNFGLPMAIQNKESLDNYRNKSFDSIIEVTKAHSNHYSTSSYVCYYLMRLNPFTNNMIKLQSNHFDSPERQFIDIEDTLYLCWEAQINRELIPEIYSIPEMYININYNDFGKLTINKFSFQRINNVNVTTYADNIFDFVYRMKKMINYNEKINNKICNWFNFIFGDTQYNKENVKDYCLRNFAYESYSQNVNIKKIIEDMIKQKKSIKEILTDVKTKIGIILNFGQCPCQLFTSDHPIKECEIPKNNNINDNKNNGNDDNIKINNDINKNVKILQIIDRIENNSDYIWLNKFINNNSCNNLYFLINNKEIIIYQKDVKANNYIYKNKIQIDDNYISNSFNNKEKKFIFCELKTDFFIFSEFLDNAIIINYNTEQYTYLLSSPVSCITKIKNNEFMTGHENGMIFHWRIENLENKIEMRLVKKLQSNIKMIKFIKYSQKLSVIVVSDENNIIIRNFYDFEFLNCIKISSEQIIIDAKISDYNFIYLLIYDKEREMNELRGYSINGIFFGKIEKKISSFNITERGNIILCLKNDNKIYVLNPVNFKELFIKNIFEKQFNLTGNITVNIQVEKFNIIIICEIQIVDKTIIEIIKLDEEESKYFL